MHLYEFNQLKKISVEKRVNKKDCGRADRKNCPTTVNCQFIGDREKFDLDSFCGRKSK